MFLAWADVLRMTHFTKLCHCKYNLLSFVALTKLLCIMEDFVKNVESVLSKNLILVNVSFWKLLQVSALVKSGEYLEKTVRSVAFRISSYMP